VRKHERRVKRSLPFAVVSMFILAIVLIAGLNVLMSVTRYTPDPSEEKREAQVDLSARSASAQSQQTIQRIMNDVWDKTGKRIMTTPWAGAQGTSQSETFIWNDVWDQANHLIRTSGGAGPSGPSGPVNFTDLIGTASDAQIPNLNTLSTGLTPSRCVQTDAVGHLSVASDACGTGGGGGGDSTPENVVSAQIVCDGTTDVGPALQALFDSVPVGTRIALPPGICSLNQALVINQSVSLEGAGMNQTTLRQTVSNARVLTVQTYSVTIEGLTFSHSGTPTAGGDGLVVLGPGGVPIFAVTIMNTMATHNWRGYAIGPVSYAQMAHVWAMNNDSHGFEFLYTAADGGGSQQWHVLNALSQQNLGAGYYGNNTLAANGIGPWLTESISFANNAGGFVFVGSSGHMISAVRLNAIDASTDNVHGVYLDTFGGSHQLVMPSVENVGLNAGIPIGSAGTLSVASNTGHGIEVTANNNYGVMINGGTIWNNSWSGIVLNAPSSQLIGGQTVGNGKALIADPTKRAALYIGGNNTLVDGHTFQFIGDGSTQDYITLAGGVTGTVIGVNSYAAGLAAETSTLAGLPAGSTDFVGTGGPGQVLKQLSVGGPVTVGPLSSGEVGLGNVDNTSDTTKNSNPAVLTNKQIVARIPTCTVTGSGPFIITPNADTTDVCESYAITGALQIANPTATGSNPRPHQRLEFALKAATPQTVTFTGSLYDNSCGQPLPTNLTGDGSTTDHFLFAFNPNTNKFCALASSRAPAKRLNTFTSAVASPTLTCVSPTTDRCQLTATGATGTITIANPTGLPNDGDMMMIALLCSAVHAVAWDTQFVGSPNIPLPTTAACPADTAKWTVFGVQYSASLAPPKWQLLGAN